MHTEAPRGILCTWRVDISSWPQADIEQSLRRGRNLPQQGQFLVLHPRSPWQSFLDQSQGSAPRSTRPGMWAPAAPSTLSVFSSSAVFACLTTSGLAVFFLCLFERRVWFLQAFSSNLFVLCGIPTSSLKILGKSPGLWDA